MVRWLFHAKPPAKQLSGYLQMNPQGLELKYKYILLTHCGLVMPYGNRDLGQLWLR